MWLLIPLGIGVVISLIAKSHDRNTSDTLHSSTDSLVWVEDPLGITGTVQVVWAKIPFEDSTGCSKVRPFAVLSQTDETLTGLPLYSRAGTTSNRQAWVPTSIESAKTYDYKNRLSWIKVCPPQTLTVDCLAFPGREPGLLTFEDERLLRACLVEYEYWPSV